MLGIENLKVVTGFGELDHVNNRFDAQYLSSITGEQAKATRGLARD